MGIQVGWSTPGMATKLQNNQPDCSNYSYQELAQSMGTREMIHLLWAFLCTNFTEGTLKNTWPRILKKQARNLRQCRSQLQARWLAQTFEFSCIHQASGIRHLNGTQNRASGASSMITGLSWQGPVWETGEGWQMAGKCRPPSHRGYAPSIIKSPTDKG